MKKITKQEYKEMIEEADKYIGRDDLTDTELELLKSIAVLIGEYEDLNCKI